MGRCPRCHRRLAAGTRCRHDGGEAGAAAASAELAGAMTAPHVPGLRVQRLLGAGGFASVWEAVDGDRPVAIKVSHSSGAAVDERFAHEAEALRRVGPPAVPALLGAGTLPDQRSYLCMELLAGTALSTWLEARAEPPAWSEAVALFRAVLDRVALVHRASLVHLDLKPENVFLAGDPPVATLIDLGLARATSGASLPGTTDGGGDAQGGTPPGFLRTPPDQALGKPFEGGTPPGFLRTPADQALGRPFVVGTPEYMAPEQLRGEAVDARADLYALGVVLHELLTGRPPFTGDRAAVEHGHLALRPPRSSPAGVPPAVDEVVLRCLAKDPADRFPDADALDEALAAATRASSAGPTPAAAAPPADQASSPRREPASRSRAALLFCRAAPARLVDLRAALEASGGALAHVAGDTAAGAFTAATGEHPVKRAVAAARRLCERGVCERILVDLQAVVTMARPGGPARLMSPLFTRPDRYPGADDPPGVLLTAEARDALGADVAVDPIPGRADRVALRREPPAESAEATGFHRPVERMLGRDDTLEGLVGSARAAVAARTPAVATVIGEQGLGKSHLAAVLVDRLGTELAAIDLLALRVSEPIAGDTDRFLALLLRHALGLGDLAGEAGRRRLEARLGADLAAEVHSAVALALGWVGADDPGVARLRATPGVLRAATARAIGEGLRRRALERPLCLVVDDAHWADPTSLDGLEYATADDARAPLWLAVIARPGLEQARPAWGTRAADHRRERLGPLERGAAAALCRRLLAPAEHVPQSVVDRLVDRSQANPLLLVDLVGGLRRQGLVQERPGRGATVVTELLDRMPDMPVVEWIAARAIDSLAPDLAAYGRLAARLGADFTDRELGGIAAELDRSGAGFRTDAGVALRQLCDAGLLVRHRDERYGLRSSLGRDAVAAAAPDELRRRVDRAALDFFRRAPPGVESGRRLSRVALHAAAVGERDEAAAAYLELAEGARARHAYLEAELLYTSALGSTDPEEGERRLAGLRGRGIVRYRLGRYDDSLADLRLAGGLAGERGDRPLEADLLLDAAMALDWLEEWRESRELTRRAAELIQPRDPPLLRARLLQAEGRSANRFNQDTDGIRLYEEAIAVAEPLGDEAYEVLVTSLLLLGFVLPFVGRPDDAEACLERALALCQSTGDELHLGAVYNNRSCLWIALNDQRRALEDMDRARGYARRLGISNLERMVELNLGIYLYWLGELDQAEPHIERLIQLDQRRMRSGVRPDGQVLRARLRFARGDLEGCRRELAEIVHHQEEATRQHAPDVLLMPSDRVLFDAVSLAAGGGDEAAWDAVCARADQVSQGQELIEVMELRGLAEARAGRADAARRAWHQALEVGARIPNVFEARLRRRLAELDPAGPSLSPAPRR